MSTSPASPISDAELQHRHEQVPPDYYHQGVQHNLLQRLWHGRRTPVVASFLRNRGGRLLDLGCHSGYMTAIIGRVSGAIITGIDISPDAIAYARQHNPVMTFVVGDLQRPLPFADAAFNTATAFDVLEHVPNLRQVFQELRRVLVPGGSFIIGVPRETWLWRLVWRFWIKARGAVWDDVHVHEFTSTGLRGLTSEHGLTFIREQVSHWGMYLVMEFQRDT